MQPSQDLRTREGALAFMTTYREFARERFAEHQRLIHHAIVFSEVSLEDGEAFRDPTTGGLVVTVNFLFMEDPSPEGKDHFVKVLVEAIEKSRGVGMVMEAWMARIDPAKKQTRADFPESLETPFAGRREGIMVSLEHVALERPISWMAEIARDAKGHGVAAPFSEGPAVRASEGRFTHLLRRAAS